MQFSHLVPRHQDVVHDIKFDFYGNRFATCSSDRDIKVWDLVDTTGKWKCHTIQHAHAANIWRLSWAHPQYGKLFASCSEDTTVNIFEEQGKGGHIDVVIVVAQITQHVSTSTSSPAAEARPSSKWHRRKAIAVSKRPVHDVAFAPPHLGLKLATASQDGKVKFFEPAHVFDIKEWTSTVRVFRTVCLLTLFRRVSSKRSHLHLHRWVCYVCVGICLRAIIPVLWLEVPLNELLYGFSLENSGKRFGCFFLL